MQHSLETYFLFNFAADAALFAVIARANEMLRIQRVLFCGFIAASYAVLVKVVSVQLAHPAIQFVLLATLGILLCGDHDLRRWFPASFQLFGSAMLLGGFGTFFASRRNLVVPALGIGLIFLGLWLNIHRRQLLTWEVTVLVSFRGRTVSFPALIDTGNRLREPLSGLPVLIAESVLLKDLFASASIDSAVSRRIAFGVLGSSGAMRCFRPDAVLIRRGEQLLRAPDVWIAAFPGTIPGAARALAPPSFAVIPGKSPI